MSNTSEFASFQNLSHGFQNLGTFWGGREFSDVTLVTSDGGHITAHRLVLSLFSELFRTALARCSNQPNTLIYLAGLKGKHLEQLVKLMYFGELRVERQEVEDFLATALELKIGGIVEVKIGEDEVLAKVENVANDRHNDYPAFFTSTDLYEETEPSGESKPTAEDALRQEPLLIEYLNIKDSAKTDEGEFVDTFSNPEKIGTGKAHTSIIPPETNNYSETIQDDFDHGTKSIEPASLKPHSDSDQQLLSESNENHLQPIVMKFCCSDCDQSFKTKKGLWFHNQSKHLGVVHPCDICNKVFNTTPSLKHHIAVAHKGRRYKCNSCPMMLTSPFSLKGHMRRHRGEKEKCDICDQEFNKYSTLRLHKNQNHLGISSEIYFCKTCDWSGTKRGIVSHNEMIHNGKVFECDQCKYKSFQQTALTSHKNNKHNGSKHACQLCKKTFHQEAILIRHVQSVHEGVWHFCDECDRSFSLRGSLNTHKTKIHEKGTSHNKLMQKTKSPKILFCGLCNFETSEKVGLKNHVMAVHTNSHKCEMCDAEFFKEEKLEAHRKNKHEDASYNCDACKFRTKFSRELKQHKEINHA